MAVGQIMPRQGEEKAGDYAKRLREAVEERTKAKGISLADALKEVLEENKFHGFSADQRLVIETLQTERQAGKGWWRDAFARAVNEKRAEIMLREPLLSEREIFLKATALVIQEDRHILSDYRTDIETI